MKLEKIIVVLGPPGSGKGTQSALLAKFFNVPRIVMGDLIREFIQEDSQIAKESKERYDKGIPQPDEIASMLLARKLKTITDSEIAVFDTYPLSMGQAHDLDRIAGEMNIKDLKIIFLNVDKNEVIKRISSRGQQRSDDKPEIAAARFDEYEKRNAPIKEYYNQKGILIEINGDQPIKQVHQEILSKLGI